MVQFKDILLEISKILTPAQKVEIWGSHKMIIEIVKAISVQFELIIMDEPIMVLTQK